MATDSQRNFRSSVRAASAVVTPGATVPPPSRGPADGWLAPILLGGNLVAQAQLDSLMSQPPAKIWTSVVASGWTTDQAIATEIARVFRLPLANLASTDPRVTTLLPEAVARKHQVVPISANDRTIQIATADPRDLDMEQTLRFVTGRDIGFQVGTPEAIAARLDELYRPERAIERLLVGLPETPVVALDANPAPVEADRELDGPVTKLVDAMIHDAIREGASDIHAEPTDGAVVVRYRIDGVLREVMRLPDTAGAALVRRVKIWAKLDVTDPLRPHDGRAMARVGNQTVDLRVSTIPVARRGEKVVVRILDKNNLCGNLAQLKLPANEHEALERLLGHREGMVLVTGPTGSGKTTTLYAALNQLKTGKVNIVTVEDPVEYEVAGISQIQVSDAQGLTFARGPAIGAPPGPGHRARR